MKVTKLILSMELAARVVWSSIGGNNSWSSNWSWSSSILSSNWGRVGSNCIWISSIGKSWGSNNFSLLTETSCNYSRQSNLELKSLLQYSFP